jgi:hypothetical protein
LIFQLLSLDPVLPTGRRSGVEQKFLEGIVFCHVFMRTLMLPVTFVFAVASAGVAAASALLLNF